MLRRFSFQQQHQLTSRAFSVVTAVKRTVRAIGEKSERRSPVNTSNKNTKTPFAAPTEKQVAQGKVTKALIAVGLLLVCYVLLEKSTANAASKKSKSVL